MVWSARLPLGETLGGSVLYIDFRSARRSCGWHSPLGTPLSLSWISTIAMTPYSPNHWELGAIFDQNLGEGSSLPLRTNSQTNSSKKPQEGERRWKNSVLSAAFVVQIEAGNVINVLTKIGGTLMLTDSHMGAACGTTLEGRLPITQVIKARCSFLLVSEPPFVEKAYVLLRPDWPWLVRTGSCFFWKERLSSFI